ncbi:ADP-ribosylglycohydrolase family protein [Bergeyella zoohelcum]|uniref:ADP-ribosylglycohydrolase n=1 Tax=Bergeyella zoohelcum ATCC 43767 TaxID=883096 RepID=K1LKW5_9FLAO|nr:ADP-ribosylglycohydrolase family protein [Bergeyella zoohelcum]EKB57400.1 hypothetical protein HMPREF9699_00886 [Bergeyella zoohelcum ATCC 43767]SUV48929.1 ADP-ribosyl-[dinitrogen reductase] glycohydrolase [Bergeyella zoohelcum]
MNAISKYKGSIKLSAIGDALGWITEFERNTTSLREKYGVERIEKFYTWKKYVGGRFYGYLDNIKEGSYSDDTQLLLSVARSIEKNGNVNQDYFAKIELANWLEYARGGGRTVKTAAEKIQRKSVKWFSNFYKFKVNGKSYDYRQSGANGAAMRVLPIALANLGDTNKIKEEIFCNSIVTHGHPRAILGAMLYGYAINKIITLDPKDFSWENYLTHIGKNFPEKFALTFLDKYEIKEWLNEWNKSSEEPFEKIYSETLIETQNYLRLIYQQIKQDTTVFDTLTKLGCYAPETKGSGTSTVLAGIYLTLKYHNNPLQAVIEGVNSLGTDTDSIAAFTGGLIGALHGQQIIPSKWKNVQDESYLNTISERLLAISEDRYIEQTIQDFPSIKNINDIKNDNLQISDEVHFIPLGKGKIASIDRQDTLTKGKYNVIIEIIFESNQSIIISKLFNYSNENTQKNTDYKGDILKLAEKKLNPKNFALFKKYIENKSIDNSLIKILQLIIENKE